MPPWAWWTLYNLLQLLGLPALLLWLAYRKAVLGKGEGWSERFGGSPITPQNAPRPVWIHAVSAGEVAAATPLLRALADRAPDLPIVLSTLTPAGRAMADKLTPPPSAVFYYPWDLLLVVGRSLRRVRPRAVILMEAEFWPNFLSRLRSLGIPVMVANGRISERGYRRARRVSGLMRWAYGLVSAFGMQSEVDARRALSLGAPTDRVRVLGQTKFDAEDGPLSPEDALRLRHDLGLPDGAPVIVGGSTRPGEEAALLEVLTALRPRLPELRLVLAPRHLERTEEVAALALSNGFTAGRRTAPLLGADVVLLDTMGELGQVYAVGDVAFVGGTLTNIGGHNPLQPVAQGKPVFLGPHTQNVRDLAELLIGAGVGFRVTDAESLAAGMADLLTHPEKAEAIKTRALEVVAAHRGASARYAELLLSLLPPQGKTPR